MSPNVRLISIDDGRGSLAKNEIYPYRSEIAVAIDRFCSLEKPAYQAIFSHYWISGSVGKHLQEAWNIPHLVMFHTLGRAKNEACSSEDEPDLRIAEEERLARECDLIIAAARSEKERLLTYYGLPPEKVAVIPCGIDRSLFRPLEREKTKKKLGGAPGDEKIILSAGRIEPVKGLDLLIRAAAFLSAEDNFKLLIAGGDQQSIPQIANLKETAAELGIAGIVNFPGLVDHVRLPDYYNAANVTVLPSYYESFGLVALESIACGTPIVAGPVGIVPELLTEDPAHRLGYLVTGRHPDQWAAAIREALLRSEPINQNDIDAALAPFSWPVIAQKLTGCLDNL